MSEKHRKRQRVFQIHLLDEELDILSNKAEEAGMSRTEFIRNVILFGAARGKTNIDHQEVKTLAYEINRIGNNINQIAYQANLRCVVDEGMFLGLQNEFSNLLKVFEDYIAK